MIEVMTMGEMLVEIMRPRADMPLDEAGEFLGPFPSGAPAIFIDTVARLGHGAAIVGGVGRDDFGRCLTERLRRDGVDLRWVEESPQGSTAVAFVTYFADGTRRFIFHIDGTPAVRAVFPGTVHGEPPRFFHVMGCSLMAGESLHGEIVRAVEYLHGRGAWISFDPNIRPELLGERSLMDVVGPVLSRASVLMPGEAELAMIGGSEDEEESLARLFQREALELVVVKRGSRGASVFERGGRVDAAAFRVEERDPTGAGDCFDAAFLCGLLEQRPLEECARMAAAAGALDAAAFGPMEGNISARTVTDLMGRSG
jgi:sugar/nucleoside kinase (ribokinase family)